MTTLALARLPQLRSLVLGEPRSSSFGRLLWEPLLTANWLGQLDELSVEQHPLPAELVAPLCVKFRAGAIRSLALINVSLGDAGAADLARSGLLDQITELRLDDNGIGPYGARLLSDTLPASADLVLDGNTVADGGLAALAGSPLLRHMTRLAVAGPMPADGAGAAAPRPRRRPSRSVDDPSLDSQAVLALAASPYARRLRSLTLIGGSIDSEAAQALLTSPQLGALDFLKLSDTLIDALPACRHANLAYLYLTGNCLQGVGITVFCAGSRLPALETLCLDGNQLGPEAAAALASASGFDTLEELRLCDNPLGDEGVRALATGRGLPRLARLDLTSCGIGDEGVAALASSPLVSRLKRLRLKSTGNPMSEQAYRAFRERASECGCQVD
jgi:hypothetical protein